MVIRGGKKVYLEDVDRCIEDIPEVNQCVSIGLMEAGKIDKSVSFIVLRNAEHGIESSIRAYIRSRLSTQHIPDEIYFIAEIPRTKSGKPIMNSLRHLMQIS